MKGKRGMRVNRMNKDGMFATGIVRSEIAWSLVVRSRCFTVSHGVYQAMQTR
jgi:hypothetical protein